MPPHYTHCPYCGASVLNADRVNIRVPAENNYGDIAVVSNVEMIAEDWRRLANTVEATAKNFERDEEGNAAPQQEVK